MKSGKKPAQKKKGKTFLPSLQSLATSLPPPPPDNPIIVPETTESKNLPEKTEDSKSVVEEETDKKECILDIYDKDSKLRKILRNIYDNPLNYCYRKRLFTYIFQKGFPLFSHLIRKQFKKILNFGNNRDYYEYFGDKEINFIYEVLKPLWFGDNERYSNLPWLFIGGVPEGISIYKIRQLKEAIKINKNLNLLEWNCKKLCPQSKIYDNLYGFSIGEEVSNSKLRNKIFISFLENCKKSSKRKIKNKLFILNFNDSLLGEKDFLLLNNYSYLYPNLLKLNISFCRINENSLKLLQKCKFFNNLVELNLAWCGLNDRIITSGWFSNFTTNNLVELNLSYNNLGKSSLKRLFIENNLSKLKTLFLSCCGLKSDDLENILNNDDFSPKLLEYLDLSRNSISQEICTILKHSSFFRNLKSLDLSRNNMKITQVMKFAKSFSVCENLERLDLSGNRVDDELVSKLLLNSFASKLKVLALKETQITEKTIKFLYNHINLKELKILDLRKTSITPEQAEILFDSPNLTKLDRIYL